MSIKVVVWRQYRGGSEDLVQKCLCMEVVLACSYSGSMPRSRYSIHLCIVCSMRRYRYSIHLCIVQRQYAKVGCSIDLCVVQIQVQYRGCVRRSYTMYPDVYCPILYLYCPIHRYSIEVAWEDLCRCIQIYILYDVSRSVLPYTIPG